MTEPAPAPAMPVPGVCRVCGCTELDCRQCIERTGAPCSWVDAARTLCTACIGIGGVFSAEALGLRPGTEPTRETNMNQMMKETLAQAAAMVAAVGKTTDSSAQRERCDTICNLIAIEIGFIVLREKDLARISAFERAKQEAACANPS
jgi:hypothetical protein